MDLAFAPIGWISLFVIAVTFVGLLQCIANLRASRRTNQIEDLVEEVAHLRDEVAQLRKFVERRSEAADETIDSIRAKPL